MTEAIHHLLDRPIAFQRAFVRIGAGITGALFLSQAVYWSSRTNDTDGWFYKTQAEWEEETGLSRYEQEGARKSLKKLGVLEEVLYGVPAKLHYRVNVDSLLAYLSAENQQTSMRKTSKLVCGKPANKMRENQQTYTETTAETTTETTADTFPLASAEATAPLAVTGETDLQAACRATWQAYAAAYRGRHGVAPVRNAKVNANVKQLVQRLGREEAPQVAAFFLSVNERFVVQGMHDLGALLARCEAYRTQWATGRQVTEASARQVDKTQANFNAADEAKAILRARRGSNAV